MSLVIPKLGGNRKSYWFLLTSFIAAAFACAGSPPTTSVSSEVAALVAPVLNAQAAVFARDDEQNESILSEKVASILRDQSPTGTEALAILLGFYVGEASGEDISCELVSRGKSTIPLLHRYSTWEGAVSGVEMSHVRRTRTEYPIVESRINSGEHCVVER